MKLTCYAAVLIVFMFGGLQMVQAHLNQPKPAFCPTPGGCIPVDDVQWAKVVPSL